MRKDLVVIILTYGLEENIHTVKFTPKVCHNVEEKTMIEMAIENALKLVPNKIYLYVSKYNIQCINKVIKHADYSKMISYSLINNERRSLKNAYRCFNGKNVLVMPANSPLLSTKTLYRMVSENRDVKVKDNLFYLRNVSLDYLDNIKKMEKTEFMVPEIELKEVELKEDLDFVKNYMEEKSKKMKKYGYKGSD